MRSFWGDLILRREGVFRLPASPSSGARASFVSSRVLILRWPRPALEGEDAGSLRIRARASKERTRGRSRIRARASKDEVVVYAEISQAPIFSLALR
jgi:hypothetical protein